MIKRYSPIEVMTDIERLEQINRRNAWIMFWAILGGVSLCVVLVLWLAKVLG
jgi:hypothetical protein